MTKEMYKIVDLQVGGYFADGEMFKNEKEVVEQLISYHDIDFAGADDKDKELSIEEYFKFWKINTTKEQLNWLLDWGSWELEKVS